MSRGKQWTSEMDEVLRARYADTKNSVLAAEYGYGIRTITRHGTILGLGKSEAFLESVWREGVRESARWCEYMRITGQKMKRRPGGRPWEKGHRFEGEIEERRVKALRDRSADERLRILRGWTRKTRWPMVDYGTGKKV